MADTTPSLRGIGAIMTLNTGNMSVYPKQYMGVCWPSRYPTATNAESTGTTYQHQRHGSDYTIRQSWELLGTAGVAHGSRQ